MKVPHERQCLDASTIQLAPPSTPVALERLSDLTRQDCNRQPVLVSPEPSLLEPSLDSDPSVLDVLLSAPDFVFSKQGLDFLRGPASKVRLEVLLKLKQYVEMGNPRRSQVSDSERALAAKAAEILVSPEGLARLRDENKDVRVAMFSSLQHVVAFGRSDLAEKAKDLLVSPEGLALP